MKIERTRNAIRNSFSGVANRVVGLLIPFLLRTVLIKVLGEQYLGLSSLFSSILQVLNITELGFSSAMVYSMYEPIAKDDTNTICAMLQLYRKIYICMGSLILVAGICLTPFIGDFISGSVPKDINIVYLYYIFLFDTVIGYFLFAHKKSLLSALQRSDVYDNISTFLQLGLNVIKLCLLLLFKNYYLYVIFSPILTVCQQLIINVYTKRKYPQYVCKGKLDRSVISEITKRVSALAIQKIGNTISLSLDSVIISSFLGLTVLAVYSNYFYIVSSLMSILTICITSMTAGIGNSIVCETKEKNYQDFFKVLMLNGWVVCLVASCLLTLYQHFMKIWVGEKLMFSMDMVILMVIYFVISQTRQVTLTYRDAAGVWHIDRLKPLVGCFVNLILNIILVKICGVKGVILSTIVSYVFIEIPWENRTLFKVYFNMPLKNYYKKLAGYMGVTIIAISMSFGACLALPNEGIVWFLVKGIITCLISNSIFILIYYKTKEFNSLYQLFKGMINKFKSNKCINRRDVHYD